MAERGVGLGIYEEGKADFRTVHAWSRWRHIVGVSHIHIWASQEGKVGGKTYPLVRSQQLDLRVQ